VNQRFAAEYFLGKDAIGQRLRLVAGNNAQSWLTIIGVASNISQDLNRQEIHPLLAKRRRHVGIRSQRDPAVVDCRAGLEMDFTS
jgi:hypothetical protein